MDITKALTRSQAATFTLLDWDNEPEGTTVIAELLRYRGDLDLVCLTMKTHQAPMGDSAGPGTLIEAVVSELVPTIGVDFEMVVEATIAAGPGRVEITTDYAVIEYLVDVKNGIPQDPKGIRIRSCTDQEADSKKVLAALWAGKIFV